MGLTLASATQVLQTVAAAVELLVHEADLAHRGDRNAGIGRRSDGEQIAAPRGAAVRRAPNVQRICGGRAAFPVDDVDVLAVVRIDRNRQPLARALRSD